MEEKQRKELLRKGMRGIRPVIERNIRSGREVDVRALVEMEKKNVLEFLSGDMSRNWVMLGECIEHVMVADSLVPDLERMTRELELKCRKAEKVRSINETTVRAVLGAALAGAGYRYFYFYPQRYRIKVQVYLKGTSVTVPLKYSALPGAVDDVLPALKDAERLITKFGRDFRIG